MKEWDVKYDRYISYKKNITLLCSSSSLSSTNEFDDINSQIEQQNNIVEEIKPNDSSTPLFNNHDKSITNIDHDKPLSKMYSKCTNNINTINSNINNKPIYDNTYIYNSNIKSIFDDICIKKHKFNTKEIYDDTYMEKYKFNTKEIYDDTNNNKYKFNTKEIKKFDK